MYSEQRTNDIIFDFSCIFWDFLMQWKAVLILSLITAVLVSGIKYRKDSAEYAAAIAAANEYNITEAQAEQRIHDILDALPDEDKGFVKHALGYKSLLSEKLKYQAESPLMGIDYNHTNVMTLCFQVSGDLDSLSISSLESGYLATFNNNDTLQSLSAVTESAIDPCYIKELISFSDPSVALSQIPSELFQSDNIFYFYMIIPPNESQNNLEDSIISAFKNQCSELSSSIAPHKIELISEDFSTISCNSVYAKQADVYFSLSNLKSYFNSAVSELNEQQSAAYNTILQLQNVIEQHNTSATSSEVKTPEKSRISKRASVLGLVLGIILYFFLYIIHTLLREKVPSSGIAKKILHKRLLGEYYTLVPRERFFEKLICSPVVFKCRYRGKTDADQQSEHITQVLHTISSKQSIHNLAVITTADEQNPFLDKIKQKCEKLGLSIELKHVSKDDISDKVIENIDNAILSVSNETEVNLLNTLDDMLSYYRINVVGFIFTANH